MKISALLLIFSLFFFPAFNAQASVKYVGELIVISHHNTADKEAKAPDYYRDIAFDDYGRMYGLRGAHVDIYNRYGEFTEIVSFISLTVANKLPTQLEVLGDGTRLYVEIKGTTYTINLKGQLVSKKSVVAYPLIRRPDDVFIGFFREPIYDKELNYINEAPSWLVDSKGNYFKFYDGPLIKFSKDGETIWDKNFGRYSVIGIDAEDNIYLLRGTFSIDKDVRKVDPDGNVITTIDLMPKEIFFTRDAIEKINPYLWYQPGMPSTPETPNVRVFVTADGSIYQWFDFSMLSKKQTAAWLESGDMGGKYIIYKYSRLSKDTQEENVELALRVVKDIFNKKKYEGSSSEYDLKELVESAGFRLSGQKLYMRTLRNEIFARHGRIFESEDLKRIFEACDWYRPNPNYSDDMLNDIEKKNIQFILDYEKKMGWR